MQIFVTVLVPFISLIIRLFDSQNNARGGYNAQGITHYAGGVMNIEWTNQHQCGGDNNNCELVLQYMCGEKVRNGITEK